MDFPNTQAMDDDGPATQRFSDEDDDDKNTLVATLLMDNKTHSIYSGGTYSIGRHPDCQIILNHATISKFHAEIVTESSGNSIFIKDLRSSNKTRINNKKIKPNAFYQVKNNDVLKFGNVEGILKMVNVIDDSIISIDNEKKNISIVPGTPDSSMNASENDLSIIPGTQSDEINVSFKHPQILSQNLGKDNNKKSIVTPTEISSSDMSKSNQDAEDEIETQRFIGDKPKEICTNSTYNSSTTVQNEDDEDDEDEDIFEMVTQKSRVNEDEFTNMIPKPFESRKSKHNESIHNAETQESHLSIRNLEKSKSEKSTSNLHDGSIFSTETQKVSAEISQTESITEMATQKFESSILDKSNESSIYSASTQKYEEPININFEDLNTQPAYIENKDCPSASKNQKSLTDCSVDDLETQCLEDQTTQKFENEDLNKSTTRRVSARKSTGPTSKTQESEVSNQDLETQKFVSEDLNKSTTRRVSARKSTGPTSNSQESEVSNQDLETQRIEYTSNTFKTPTRPTKKSVKTPKTVISTLVEESLEDMNTQKVDGCDSDVLMASSTTSFKKSLETSKKLEQMDLLVEDLETQCFDKEKSFVSSTPSIKYKKFNNEILNTSNIKGTAPIVMTDESLGDLETQSFKEKCSDISKKNLINTTIENADTQIFNPTESVEKSIQDQETQQFDNTKIKEFQTPTTSSINRIKSKASESSTAIENIETQAFVPNESMKFIDETLIDFENPSFTHKKSSRQSNSSVKKVDESKQKLNESKKEESIDDLETQQFVEKSSVVIDESVMDESNDSVSTTLSLSSKNIKTKKNLSSRKNDKSFNSTKSNDFSAEQQNNSKTSEAIENRSNDNLLVEQKNTDTRQNEDNEDEMFYSQNIIDEIPFQCSNEESGEDEIPSTSEKSVSKKDDSINQSKVDLCQSKKILEKSLQDQKQVETTIDSDTDEEGIFSDVFSSEDKKEKSKINVTLKESDKSVKNDGSKKTISIEENDSETDEEGTFSSHLSEKYENPKSLDANTSKNLENKFCDSETDEEGQFSLHFSKIGNTMTESFGSDAKYQSHSKNSSNVESLQSKKENDVSKVVPLDQDEDNAEDSEENDQQQTVASKSFNRSKSTKDESVSKVINVSLKHKFSDANKKETEKNCELEPTQLMDTKSIDTQDISSNENCFSPIEQKRKSMRTRKSQNQNLSFKKNTTIDENMELDLAPTQIVTETELEPTQLVDKACTEKDKTTDDIESAPTQKLEEIFSSPNKSNVHHQKTLTPQLNKVETRLSMKSSKREYQELLITSSSKKMKMTVNSSKQNLNDTVEKDLYRLFDQSQDKEATIIEESLLTQQLEKILESSQMDVDASTSEACPIVPSPTLGSRRTLLRRKSQRDSQPSKKLNLSARSIEKNADFLKKQSTDKDDSVEYNLNELFDDDVNDFEPVDADSIMMTQQLENILNSQEEVNNEQSIKIATPKVTPVIDKRRQNLNTPSNASKGKTTCVSRLSIQKTTSEKNSSTDSEKEIVYRRGTIGFSSDLSLVMTHDPVTFLRSKSAPFSDNSQSDDNFSGETLARSESNGSTSNKKRLNLSLKNVNLNSSFASLCDDDNKKDNLSPNRSCNDKKSPLISGRRVRRHGTRGFNNEDLVPVSSDELVSANSEFNDEQQQQVCSQSSNICKKLNYDSVNDKNKDNDEDDDNDSKEKEIASASQMSRKNTKNNNVENDSDDDDFFKDMPAIKVAGTADCPPTTSQLAAPSDNEDIQSVSSNEMEIPPEGSWFNQKYYDLLQGKTKNTSVNENKIKVDKPIVNEPTLNELLAEIESSKPKRTNNNKNINDKENDQSEISDFCNTPRRRSSRFSKAIENSPSRSVVKPSNSSKLQNVIDSSSDDDDENDDNFHRIIPKYEPVKPLQLNFNLLNDDDDSNQELEELKKKYDKVLSVKNTYDNVNQRSNNTSRVNKNEKVASLQSPFGKKSSFKNVKTVDNNQNIDQQIKCKSKINAYGTPKTNENNFVFQVSSSAKKSTPTAAKNLKTKQTMKTTPQTPRPGPSKKRSNVVEDDLDDVNENLPPKRSKSAVTNLVERRSDLQEVSVLISPLRERHVINSTTNNNNNVTKRRQNQKVDDDNTNQDKKINKIKNSVVLLQKQSSKINLLTSSTNVTTVAKNKVSKIDTDNQSDSDSEFKTKFITSSKRTQNVKVTRATTANKKISQEKKSDIKGSPSSLKIHVTTRSTRAQKSNSKVTLNNKKPLVHDTSDSEDSDDSEVSKVSINSKRRGVAVAKVNLVKSNEEKEIKNNNKKSNTKKTAVKETSKSEVVIEKSDAKKLENNVRVTRTRAKNINPSTSNNEEKKQDVKKIINVHKSNDEKLDSKQSNPSITTNTRSLRTRNKITSVTEPDVIKSTTTHGKNLEKSNKVQSKNILEDNSVKTTRTTRAKNTREETTVKSENTDNNLATKSLNTRLRKRAALPEPIKVDDATNVVDKKILRGQVNKKKVTFETPKKEEEEEPRAKRTRLDSKSKVSVDLKRGQINDSKKEKTLSSSTTFGVTTRRKKMLNNN